MSSSDIAAISVTALVMGPVMMIVIIGMILSHRKKMATLAGPGPDEYRAMQSLEETARRMEQRISYLERVLDTEAPGWRSRSGIG